jgi:hypothetical protein
MATARSFLPDSPLARPGAVPSRRERDARVPKGLMLLGEQPPTVVPDAPECSYKPDPLEATDVTEYVGSCGLKTIVRARLR